MIDEQNDNAIEGTQTLDDGSDETEPLSVQQAARIDAERKKSETDEQGRPRFDLAGNVLTEAAHAAFEEHERIMAEPMPSPDEQERAFALRAKEEGLPDEAVDRLLQARKLQREAGGNIGSVLDKMDALTALEAERRWLLDRGIDPGALPPEAEALYDEMAPVDALIEAPEEPAQPEQTPEPQPILPQMGDETAFIQQRQAAFEQAIIGTAQRLGVDAEALKREAAPMVQALQQQQQSLHQWGQLVGTLVERQYQDAVKADPTIAQPLQDMLAHVSPDVFAALVDPQAFAQAVRMAYAGTGRAVPEGRTVGQFTPDRDKRGRYTGEEASPSVRDTTGMVEVDLTPGQRAAAQALGLDPKRDAEVLKVIAGRNQRR